jgi:hypothetical protein
MEWVWTLWVLAIFVSFAIFEGWALMKNKSTLSRATWKLSKAWPPLPFVVGFLIGFLVCHFWWGGVVCFEPA